MKAWSISNNPFENTRGKNLSCQFHRPSSIHVYQGARKKQSVALGTEAMWGTRTKMSSKPYPTINWSSVQNVVNGFVYERLITLHIMSFEVHLPSSMCHTVHDSHTMSIQTLNPEPLRFCFMHTNTRSRTRTRSHARTHAPTHARMHTHNYCVRIDCKEWSAIKHQWMEIGCYFLLLINTRKCRQGMTP